MATVQPLQNVVRHDDPLYDLGLWAKQEVLKIEGLSKQQVMSELQGIMEGHKYSWHCINALLQGKLEEGSLEFSDCHGEVLFEWKNLCDEKRMWEKNGRPSVKSEKFNVACLINLKILPIKAGLGSEALHLVTSNIDNPCLSTADLWIGPKDPESLKQQTDTEDLTDGTSSGSEDSEYIDEDEDPDCKGLEYEDVDFDGKDTEGIQMSGDDEDLGEDGFNPEESDDYGDSDSSDESDEVVTEDENLGLDLIIAESDEDISDLEL